MIIALVVIVIIIVFLAFWAVSMYNKLVKLNVSVQEGASEIEVQLKRRYDLIPNLVETVKGYATHEKSTFEEVTRARTAAQSVEGINAQSAQAEGVLTQALGHLFAVAEAYPDLKANENFLQLQNELTATEDRLAAARRFYNATVKALNTACQTIPTKFVAPIAKVSEQEFFEVETDVEREAPEISFS